MLIINEVNIIHHLKKFGSKIKVLLLKLKQYVIDIFSSRIDSGKKYGIVKLTTGDLTKISNIFTKEYSLNEAYSDEGTPDAELRKKMGFLFEYAITIYASRIANVPVLKRLGATKFEAVKPLKESLSNDEIGAQEAHDVVKKMSQADIENSSSNMMAFYMSERNKLLELSNKAKNELNKKTFEELFGIDANSEEPTAKMTDVVNDIIATFKKQGVKLVAIIHAGEYTSAMVKADISFLYMSKKQGEEEKPMLHNLSLKLYSENADYVTGLNARPYAFWYLAHNDFDANAYNEQGVDKQAREEFFDIFPDFKTIVNKRSNATDDDNKKATEIARNTLDYFIFKLQDSDNEQEVVRKFISLFHTILKGVENSEFRSYAKSMSGLYRREANIESMNEANVVVMRIKKHGDGYKIMFDYEKGNKYFYDTTLHFIPRDGKIAIEYRQSIYVKEEGENK